MAMGGASTAAGRRRHHRHGVMSEINVTPMVDVMLVLLIIFMISVNSQGQWYLQNTEIAVDDILPKLQAITAARGGMEERIFVRGDRKVDYGTVMRIMGRLSGAGFHRVALVTEVEQGK